MLLIQLLSEQLYTISAYKNTTFYGTDLTADISTIGKTNEEKDSIKKAKEIRQLWSEGTELDTDKILNKIK